MAKRSSLLGESLGLSTPAGRAWMTCHDPQPSPRPTFLRLEILVQTSLPDPFLQYIFMGLLSMDLSNPFLNRLMLSVSTTSWDRQFQNFTSTAEKKKKVLFSAGFWTDSSTSNEFQNVAEFDIKKLLWSIQSSDLREHRTAHFSLFPWFSSTRPCLQNPPSCVSKHRGSSSLFSTTTSQLTESTDLSLSVSRSTSFTFSRRAKSVPVAHSALTPCRDINGRDPRSHTWCGSDVGTLPLLRCQLGEWDPPRKAKENTSSANREQTWGVLCQ